MVDVSVIIPTCGRPQLIGRAIASVLGQTYPDLELLVVADGGDDGTTRTIVESFVDPRVRMLETETRRGPAAARNFGVEAARGRYIALLDDDDEWLPNKLRCQIQRVDQEGLAGRDFLISSRTEERVVHHGTTRTHIRPTHLYKSGSDLGAYLLDRPSPLGRPGMIASGTLLFPRELALRVPFPNDEVHEDWTWLLLCVARDHVPLLMCEDPLFIYHLNLDTASRSRRLNWRASVAWAEALRDRNLLSRPAMAGFLASTVAMRAKRHTGWAAFAELANLMRRDGQADLRHWLILLGVFALPPDLGEWWRRLTFANG
jgi:glycosyltransferase involved in cell wall biosynthesis